MSTVASVNPVITKSQTDWEICCLCQEEKEKKNENMTSPLTHYVPEHDGYTIIATNVPLFHGMCEMPLTFEPVGLDEGGGIEVTLRRNVAKYQTSCRYMFNNTKLERARKGHSDVQSESEEGQAKYRRTSHDSEACILCDRIAPASDLQQVMTMHLNNRLHECATTLIDDKLLARLIGGDAIAQELKYHCTCLTYLYNREACHLKNVEKSSCRSEAEPDIYLLVLSKLVNYMVEISLSSEGPAMFLMADISKLYTQRLEQLGIDPPSVNKTGLKENC